MGNKIRTVPLFTWTCPHCGNPILHRQPMARIECPSCKKPFDTDADDWEELGKGNFDCLVDRISELQVKVDEKTAGICSMEEVMAQQTQIIRGLRAVVNGLKQQNAELQEGIVDGPLVDARKEIERLKRGLEESRGRVQKFRDNLDMRVASKPKPMQGVLVGDWRTKLVHAQDKIKQLEKALDGSTKLVAKLEGELADEKVQAGQLRNAIADSHDQVRVLQSLNVDLLATHPNPRQILEADPASTAGPQTLQFSNSEPSATPQPSSETPPLAPNPAAVPQTPDPKQEAEPQQIMEADPAMRHPAVRSSADIRAEQDAFCERAGQFARDEAAASRRSSIGMDPDNRID